MGLFGKGMVQDGAGFWRTDVVGSAVGSERVRRIKVQGVGVLLVRAREDVVAFSPICPHAAADLGKGVFRRGQIKCPDHGYAFDVRSGRATWPEDEVCRLKRFEVKVVEGIVWVKV